MKLANFQNIVKTVGVLVFLIVVLGGVILLGKQVSSTFMAKASSCKAQNISSVQVGANSAVITWETADVSQGRVEYGTSATNLTFSAPEATSGKTHNVPLTLLTPNTVYYYLITIGNTRCDSGGSVCTTSCIPWSFTTLGITPQAQIETPLITPSLVPTAGVIVTPTATLPITTPSSGTGSSTLSTLCQQVQKNIGASSADTVKWPSVKKYDIDGNGIITGIDVIKCQKSGK
jgi:hypothetical protein